MKWTWKIGRFFGISVYMHATFLLLLGWVALSSWQETQSAAGVIKGVGFILALFACVVAHEYGHALAARRYGIITKDINLLPIGGVARLEKMPEEPKHELWVALAGPAVSVGIAVVIFVGLNLTASLVPINSLTVSTGSFLERLMLVNLFLAGFNLIPAFPMDGGRVLRALLAMRMEYTRATQTAATIGQGLALLFGFVGLLVNPFLIFIAFFVWIGAAGESRQVQLKTALEGIPVSRAMLTQFNVLTPEDTVGRAADLILAGSQQDFPVVEGNQVVGVLTRGDLVGALARQGQQARVGDVMQAEFQTADSLDMLESVFARLQTCQCHTLPVTRAGQLVGLVTMDNVGEFMSIQSALAGGRARA